MASMILKSDITRFVEITGATEEVAREYLLADDGFFDCALETYRLDQAAIAKGILAP